MSTNKKNMSDSSARKSTPVTSRSPKQTKLIAKRFLDEGFESDPDRISTDSEHPTSGTNLAGNTYKAQRNIRGSMPAHLNSSTESGISHNSTPTKTTSVPTSTPHIKDTHKQHVLTAMVAPQITRGPAKNSNAQQTHRTISDVLALGKYYKELQQHQQQMQQQQQLQQLTNTPSSTSKPGLPMRTGSPSMQRLQYQKQRQPLVATATAHQTAHNHRFFHSGNGGPNRNNNDNNSSSSGFGHARAFSISPVSPMPKPSIKLTPNHTQHSTTRVILMPRSTSVDAINRHRHGGYHPNNALLFMPHSRISDNSHPSARMMNNNMSTKALLVQPISSAILTSSKAGDLVAAAGRSPVIRTVTNSLNTFYPAEGSLQVWQSESGDLAYKSSRSQQTHKAPVCWAQSIPRQRKRVTFKI